MPITALPLYDDLVFRNPLPVFVFIKREYLSCKVLRIMCIKHFHKVSSTIKYSVIVFNELLYKNCTRQYKLL